MKSATTHSVFAREPDVGSGGVFAVPRVQHESNMPKKNATNVLVRRDANGRIAQRWTLDQPKCTLGSSDQCDIQCSLPGIEPVNLLIVCGRRQTFLRALVSNLTVDGVPANEMLLADDRNVFEVAGNRFELTWTEPGRLDASTAQTESEQSRRLRFAVARPHHAGRPSTTPRYAHAADQETPLQLAEAPWLKSLIQRTIAPLEAQIESLLLPVTDYHSQVLNTLNAQEDVHTAQQQKQVAFTQEITGSVAKHSAVIETLSERISEIDHQLGALERILASEDKSNSDERAEFVQAFEVQRAAVEQLHVGIIALSDSITQLEQRFNDSPDDQILTAVKSLQQDQNSAHEDFQRLLGNLQEQIDQLQEHVQRRAEVPSSEMSSSFSMTSAIPPSHVLPIIPSDVAESHPIPTPEDPPVQDWHKPQIDDAWVDQWTAIPQFDSAPVDTAELAEVPIEPEILEITDSGINPIQNDEFFFDLSSGGASGELDDEVQPFEPDATIQSNAERELTQVFDSQEFQAARAEHAEMPSWWNEDESRVETTSPASKFESTNFEPNDVQAWEAAGDRLDAPFESEVDDLNVQSSFEVTEEAATSPSAELQPFDQSNADDLGLIHAHAPNTSHEPAGGDAGHEEESVEDYMRSLLARMRGDEIEPPMKQTSKSPPPQTKPTSPSVSPSSQSPRMDVPVQREAPVPTETHESIDMDSYVSLTNAPEKSKNINALRELANNSARSAIRKSTRQRHVSSSLMKLAVSVLGFTFAGVLLTINGFALNIGLIATLASLLVAVIWGYDGVLSLKPLLQSGLVLPPPQPSGGQVGDEIDADEYEEDDE